MIEVTVTYANRYRMRANNHKVITVSTGTIEGNLLKVYGQPTVQIDWTAYFIYSMRPKYFSATAVTFMHFFMCILETMSSFVATFIIQGVKLVLKVLIEIIKVSYCWIYFCSLMALNIWSQVVVGS